MTIKEIIDNTKKAESDISGIKVAIKNKNESTYMEKSKEVYFGELTDIPEQFMVFEIIEVSRICASSDEERNGANVLLIKM